MVQEVDVPETDIEITTGLNQAVRLRVPGAGATGLVWDIEAPSPVTAVQPDPEPTTTFGGGGIQSFLITCPIAGEYSVRLILHAPWRRQPEQTTVITLRVTDDIRGERE